MGSCRRKKKKVEKKLNIDPFNDATLTESMSGNDDDSRGELTENLSDVTERHADTNRPMYKRALSLFTEFACNGSSTLYQDNDPILIDRMMRARFRKMSAELNETWRDIKWASLWLIFFIVVTFTMLSMLKIITTSYKIVDSYGNMSTCVYEWGPWTSCSAPCYKDNESIPYKVRRVRQHSLLDLTKISEYDDIIVKMIKIWNQHNSNSTCNNYVQYAPCNTVKCPVPVSEIKFGPCEYTNLTANLLKKEKCSRFLNLPKNSYIFIDKQVEITKECNCSDALFPY